MGSKYARSIITLCSAILSKKTIEEIIKNNYGLMGTSRWISEAMYSLLKMNNYPELVSFSDDLKGFDKSETFVADDSLKKDLDKAMVKIRKKFPLLEGVQSRIVRTAIIQRFLKKTQVT